MAVVVSTQCSTRSAAITSRGMSARDIRALRNRVESHGCARATAFTSCGRPISPWSRAERGSHGIRASVLTLAPLAIGGLFAFVGGAIVLVVLKEELPEERQSYFLPFFCGAALYAALALGELHMAT